MQMKRVLTRDFAPERKNPIPDSPIIAGRPFIDEDEIEAAAAVLRSGWVGAGSQTRAFERSFEEFIGTGTAIALNSGTAALHLALLALELQPGAEVITTSLTFAATANAIIHAGCTPVFADIDPGTCNLDPQAVENALTLRSAAILPVHLYGRTCEVDLFQELAARRGVRIIYDCAHAIEAEWEGKRVGCYGDACCYSFSATKNITTCDGGMLLTHVQGSVDRIRSLASSGVSKDGWERFSEENYAHYVVREAGFKYSMNDLVAVIGQKQLPKIESWWKRRQAIWQRYMEELADLPLILPAAPDPRTRHAYHLFAPILRMEKSPVTRDELLDMMLKSGIRLGVHFRAIHLEPYYRDRFGCRRGMYPKAEFVADRTFSLPLSPFLIDEDVTRIIRQLRRVLTESRNL
jgi:dTDP-4-amino-4,6-dideoxygalactose transaminase